MANKDAAFGFRAVTGGVAGTTPQLTEYTVASSVTIYQGQPVCLVSGVINVLNSTTRRQIVGVANHHINAADTDRTIRVSDDPAQEYLVQLDSAGSNVTTDAGLKALNFVLISPSSGNSTSMQSITELDSSSATSTNNSTTDAPMLGLRFSQEIENDQTVSWGDVVVRINPKNYVYLQIESGL